MQFYIVDVFAEKKYAGNQLAVVRGGDGLTTEAMQTIALEMNYSETTFITNEEPQNGGYDVRIFTPGEEVPFAGHPTLGTAYIIQQALIGQPVEQVTLNLAVGQIPVTFSYDDSPNEGQPTELWMHQRPPDFGETFDSQVIADLLGLDPSDMDTRFPVQDVSTGLPFIIAPLKTLEAVKRCQVNPTAYQSLIQDRRAKAILVFCPETYQPENTLNARMFALFFGVAEDAATGSANGCLAGYLVKHRYFGRDEIDVRVEQGYEINRPSLLLLRAQAGAEAIDVFVGGQVIPVAEGRLL